MVFALSPFDDLPTTGGSVAGRTGGAGCAKPPRRLFLHSDAQRVERGRKVATKRSVGPNHEDAF